MKLKLKFSKVSIPMKIRNKESKLVLDNSRIYFLVNMMEGHNIMLHITSTCMFRLSRTHKLTIVMFTPTMSA